MVNMASAQSAVPPPNGAPALSKTEQLALLRDLFQRTGAVHDATALQLKMYPFYVDPGLDRAEAHLDIEKCQLQYLWTRKDGRQQKTYKKGLPALAQWVRFLLGDSWVTVVKLNDITIFESDKQATGDRPKRQRAGRGSGGTRPRGRKRRSRR